MVHIYKEIKYLNDGVGYFPQLQDHIQHGFSWGNKRGNMSFAWGQDQAIVLNDIRTFLIDLGIQKPKKIINIIPEHSDTIVDLTDEHIHSLEYSEYKIGVDCDALFTTTKGQSLALKPADCTTSIIFARNGGGMEITGIIHAGRDGLTLELPKKAINYLVTKYSVNPKDILIGIVPMILKEDYYIEDYSKILDPSKWGGFIKQVEDRYYLDQKGLILKQYKAAGIPDENIELYKLNTYKAHEQGEGFSHRYWALNKEKTNNGRIMVVTCLKQ